MYRRVIVTAVCVTLLTAVESLAAVTVEVSMVVPVDLPGYTTFELTAVTDVGYLKALDFFNSDSKGFHGPMHQLNAPSVSTVFREDMGQLLALALSDPTYGEGLDLEELDSLDPSQDSHFIANLSSIIYVGAKESSDSLHAAFALRGLDVGDSRWKFAQIVVPNGESVNYAGDILVYPLSSSGTEEIHRISGTLSAPANFGTGIPEPGTLCLLMLGLVACASRPVQRRNS